MKIYNAFGIKPTNTYISAGTDYYIPNLDTQEKIEKAYKAFEKSYGKTNEQILEIESTLKFLFEIKHQDHLVKHIPNLIHLYFALYDYNLESIKQEDQFEAIQCFLTNFVIYDGTNDKVGLKMQLNDTLFINSGVKIALDTVISDIAGPNPQSAVQKLRMLNIGVAGLYVNKSGTGNRGWDVRACLVDEDYAGFVHLSMAYTKDVIEDKQNIIYCGDKLTQMMLIPIFHTYYEEIEEYDYNKIMSSSQRGDNGFGSSDVKH